MALSPPKGKIKIENKGTLYDFKVTSERNLIAWFSNEYGFERFELRLFGFQIRWRGQTLQVPSDPKKFKTWLFAHDPLAEEKQKGEISVVTCPMLGMLWDEKNSILCIYAKSQWIHMLPPENYSAASLELLLEPEFKKQLRLTRKEHPDVFRQNWSPVVAKGANKGLQHCQYGGVPLIKSGERRPQCKKCGADLALDLQWDFAQFPALAKRQFVDKGVLQILHCTSKACTDKMKQSGYYPLPFVGRYLGHTKNLMASQGSTFDIAAKSIVAWYKEFDGPEPEVLAEAFGEDHPFVDGDADEDTAAIYSEIFPYATDKIGGFPGYIHPKEIPQCAKCKNQMQFVYQYALDSKERFGYGNEGWIFVYQCPKHRKKFKLVYSRC